MLYFFFACTVSSSPGLNSEIESDLEGINYHLQKIEMLSNELHSAVKANDQTKIETLIIQISTSNTELQKQSQTFKDHLHHDPNDQQSP